MLSSLTRQIYVQLYLEKPKNTGSPLIDKIKRIYDYLSPDEKGLPTLIIKQTIIFLIIFLCSMFYVLFLSYELGSVSIVKADRQV